MPEEGPDCEECEHYAFGLPRRQLCRLEPWGSLQDLRGWPLGPGSWLQGLRGCLLFPRWWSRRVVFLSQGMVRIAPGLEQATPTQREASCPDEVMPPQGVFQRGQHDLAEREGTCPEEGERPARRGEWESQRPRQERSGERTRASCPWPGRRPRGAWLSN
jgi:hypothetical protein